MAVSDHHPLTKPNMDKMTSIKQFILDLDIMNFSIDILGKDADSYTDIHVKFNMRNMLSSAETEFMPVMYVILWRTLWELYYSFH